MLLKDSLPLSAKFFDALLAPVINSFNFLVVISDEVLGHLNLIINALFNILRFLGGSPGP